MTRRGLVAASLALVGACSGEPMPPAAATPAAARATPLTTAAEALDRLDQRVPVPLLPRMANHQKQNMRDHLVAVQEVVAAIAIDDFAGVEKATRRLGFSEQMGQMCTHMGAGAPSFAEQALAFHHTADRIATAAQDRDRARVLAELSTTLLSCTSCHASWKQQLVDESTGQSLTASAPPIPHAPH